MTSIKSLIKDILEEELRLAGEADAMNEIFRYMHILNPHGVTKQEFVNFLNKDLFEKYGRTAVVQALDNLKKTSCLQTKKTPGGKEVIQWRKDRCAPKPRS